MRVFSRRFPGYCECSAHHKASSNRAPHASPGHLASPVWGAAQQEQKGVGRTQTGGDRPCDTVPTPRELPCVGVYHRCATSKRRFRRATRLPASPPCRRTSPHSWHAETVRQEQGMQDTALAVASRARATCVGTHTSGSPSWRGPGGSSGPSLSSLSSSSSGPPAKASALPMAAMPSFA